jgi:serine/threonine protein kinase
MNAGVKYTLSRLHQEDSTSSLWIADCTARGKAVGNIALKALKDTSLYTGSWVYTFQKYMNMLIHTSPPIFSPVVDYGYMDGKPYIATRFYEGVSLRQCIDQLTIQRLTLPTWFALPVFILLSRALKALHKGISKENPHPLLRLTPSKIFFTSSGLIKILEHGGFSKKLIFSDQPENQIYQAPEVRNSGTGDLRADFYSLGAIFYEILTGRSPVLSGPVIPVNALSPWIPAPFQNIIMQMLNSNPDFRPDSFEALERAVSSVYNEPLSTNEIIFILSLLFPDRKANSQQAFVSNPEWEQQLRDVNFDKFEQLDQFRNAVLGKIKTSQYYTFQLHRLNEGTSSKRKLLSVVKSARSKSKTDNSSSQKAPDPTSQKSDSQIDDETELNSPGVKTS